MERKPHRPLAILGQVAWLWAVVASYFAYNGAYYAEKLESFSRFLLGKL